MREYRVPDLVAQRPPFLFLDELLELSEDFVKTKKAVTSGDFLSVSAAYIVENMAQSAAALFGYRGRSRHKPCRHMYLAGVERAEMKRCLKAGELLVTEVTVTVAVGNWGRVGCESFAVCGAEREPVASASLSLYVE